MLTNYISIFVFILLGLIGGIAVIILSILVGPRNKTKAKCSAYECGLPAFSNARMQFNVRYYLMAIFFIIFDVEMAFLFPWAIALRRIGLAGLIGMGVFLGLLAIGLIYEWRKGALEWD